MSLTGENKLDNNNKYTSEDLKIMQGWSLDRKIQVTQTRIMEWYIHYEGQVCISFSGGKDSTVLLDIARRVYPDIEAVFVDTGLEYPEIREFVKTKENIKWLRPEMNFKKVIETYGYPVGSKRTALNIEYGRKALERGDMEMFNNYVNGRRIGKQDGKEYKFMPVNQRFMKLFYSDIKVSNKCCNIMKKKPLHTYQKETGKKPIIGTMAEESKQRTAGWLKTGCNAFNTKDPQSKPMSFWTEQDVLEYLKRFNIPYSTIYGEILQDENGKYYTTGANRTGCMFCMFGCHLEKEPNRFQKLKQTHPKQYDFCMRALNDNGLGLAKVLDYIGVKYD